MICFRLTNDGLHLIIESQFWEEENGNVIESHLY